MAIKAVKVYPRPIGLAVENAVVVPFVDAGIAVVLNERLENGMNNLCLAHGKKPLSAEKIKTAIGIAAQHVDGFNGHDYFVHLWWRDMRAGE